LVCYNKTKLKFKSYFKVLMKKLMLNLQKEKPEY